MHAQTTPAAAYDTEKTIAHAKQLVATFGTYGIPKCVVAPATAMRRYSSVGATEIVSALRFPRHPRALWPWHTSKRLGSELSRQRCSLSHKRWRQVRPGACMSLHTSMVSLACPPLSVPTLRVERIPTELRVHFEPSLWREYKNTAKEHPTAAVIRDIVKSFKETGSKTLVMPARCVSSLLAPILC